MLPVPGFHCKKVNFGDSFLMLREHYLILIFLIYRFVMELFYSALIIYITYILYVLCKNLMKLRPCVFGRIGLHTSM
jgi:hypothetical protein